MSDINSVLFYFPFSTPADIYFSLIYQLLKF